MRRAIAQLVAMAATAEQVASFSFPVRFLVLWLLRRGEAVATDYFLAAAGVLPCLDAIAPAVGGSSGNAPADALRLAARLRALAASFAALLPVARRRERRVRPRNRAPGRAGEFTVRAALSMGLRANDTS